MGVRILFGSAPEVPPVLSAEVLRALRAPGGERPCSEGLTEALQWIGDREIPIEQALEEVEGVLASGDLEWGRIALGVSGYGDGDGYGSGYGDGSGYGSSYDYGHGSGYGYGSSYGYGHESGHGSGDGEEAR